MEKEKTSIQISIVNRDLLNDIKNANKGFKSVNDALNWLLEGVEINKSEIKRK